MGFVEEGSVDYFKKTFVHKGLQVSSNLLWKLDIAVWKLFFRWEFYGQYMEKLVPYMTYDSFWKFSLVYDNYKYFCGFLNVPLRPSSNLSFGEWLTDFQSFRDY